MASERTEKRERVIEYLEGTDEVVSPGRIRLDIINDEDLDISISSDEITNMVEDLRDEGIVNIVKTSGKGRGVYLSERDIEEFLELE